MIDETILNYEDMKRSRKKTSVKIDEDEENFFNEISDFLSYLEYTKDKIKKEIFPKIKSKVVNYTTQLQYISALKIGYIRNSQLVNNL